MNLDSPPRMKMERSVNLSHSEFYFHKSLYCVVVLTSYHYDSQMRSGDPRATQAVKLNMTRSDQALVLAPAEQHVYRPRLLSDSSLRRSEMCIDATQHSAPPERRFFSIAAAINMLLLRSKTLSVVETCAGRTTLRSVGFDCHSPTPGKNAQRSATT